MTTAQVQDSFQVHDGERLLKTNENKSFIVHRWFGMKSKNSKKPTWNETLLVAGPRAWVAAQWETSKATYGI